MKKYTHVFKDMESSYLPGCPVIIAAKALVKEETSGDVFAQIKYENIGSKSVKAISVSIRPCDVYGNEQSEVKNIQYLDLNEAYGSEFGSKRLIPLEPGIRSFTVKVETVCFEDGSVLEVPKAEWIKLPEQESLEDKLGAKLAKEYVRKTSEKSCYVPYKNDDIWLCSCGAANLNTAACGKCGQEYSELTAALDADTLRKEYQDRKQQEEEQEKILRAEKCRADAKRKKTLIIVGVLCLLVFTGAILVNKVIIPSNTYKDAVALYETGDYYNAAVTFDSLEKYKDSEAMADECRYLCGLELYGEGKLDEASSVLYSVREYKDAGELAEKIDIKNQLQQSRVGSYVMFGRYEQDDKDNDWDEPIRWRVLKKTGDAVMLISEQGLDVKPMNDAKEDVTWETCTLRLWLNDDFYNTAFDDAEKSFIVETQLETTRDKVYFLSRSEALSLFDGDDSRKTSNTEYAGGKVTDPYFRDWCFWWLRSQNSTVVEYAFDSVDGSGGLEAMVSPLFQGELSEEDIMNGTQMDDGDSSIRPVIWVEYNKVI